MSNLNFDDVSLTLERLRKSIDISSYTAVANPFPQVQINTPLSTLTSGLSLASSSYSGNVTYDQDIFSELPMKVFNESYNKQMAGVMKAFRTEFYERISDKPKKIIPKLYYHFDEEEGSESIRLASEWDEGNAMLYFSFEKDPQESSFGLIWNDSKKKNYQTRSGNIYLNKRTDIVHEAMDFVFRVY